MKYFYTKENDSFCSSVGSSILCCHDSIIHSFISFADKKYKRLSVYNCTIMSFFGLDAENLEVINLHKVNICNMNGLQKASSLREMYFYFTDLRNISDLSHVPKNVTIFRFENVSSLVPIDEIPKNVKKLYCKFIPLYSCDSSVKKRNLKNMPNQVGELYVSYCDLKSLKGLADSVSVLNCSNNHLKNLKHLDTSAVEEINCSSNRLITLEHLPFRTVKNMNCSSNFISDLSPVQNLKFLSYLDISNNPIAKFGKYLSNLQFLEYLFCVNCQLSSLDGIPRSVRYFDCSSNINCSPGGFRKGILPKNMIYFSCRNINLESLANLPDGLKTLDVSENKISTFLFMIPKSLQNFNCSSNSLISLNGLEVATFLKKINFNANRVTSLAGIPLSTKFIYGEYNLLNSFKYLPEKAEHVRVDILESIFINGNNNLEEIKELSGTSKFRILQEDCRNNKKSSSYVKWVNETQIYFLHEYF